MQRTWIKNDVSDSKTEISKVLGYYERKGMTQSPSSKPDMHMYHFIDGGKLIGVVITPNARGKSLRVTETYFSC